jgi:hypothetical protein
MSMSKLAPAATRTIALSFALLASACSPVPPAPLVDLDEFLDHDWRDNRDNTWFEQRVPLLDTPDDEIDATYLYRWELLTKHLVYGSPEVGYTFTEFIDRPFWSGAYGGISCPLGHQMYEVRWLKDRRIVDDFARYWMTAPGAEPRSYSNWYGDAVWATYRVLGDREWAVSMLPLMEQQVAGWVEERWDAEHGMFVWDGMHDGMETNIDSRQTPQWFDGAPGYRPTLNAYLWADMTAISKVAVLAGDVARAEEYSARAEALKARIQEELWDPEREFFFQQFARDEETVADPWPGAGNRDMGDAAVAGATMAADGSTPSIAAKSLTYETGPWAGDPHGREEIGFVPWQFSLPDSGYESAWRFLTDPEAFAAPYGPTTTEQNDPLFYVSPRCCVWSGNSWPYATSQTLTAMANLLNDYDQQIVTVDDYVELLRTYTRTQRKDGRPYIAEAADPFTGAWDGHDKAFHSEHYLHSSYVDLIITGLIGLRPQDGDRLVVNPLVPADWNWFALQDVAYRGHLVSVFWDRDGSRYGRGSGLHVLVDGETAARSERIESLRVELDPVDLEPVERYHNVAVNNERAWFPRATASSWRPEHPPQWANDGQFWYHADPPNRWVAGSAETDWIEIDFGAPRTFARIALYFIEDVGGDAFSAPPDVRVDPPEGELLVRRTDHEAAIASLPARTPTSYSLEYWTGAAWETIPGQWRFPPAPSPRRSNLVSFPPLQAERVRVVLEHREGAVSGLSELEVWSDAELPLPEPTRRPDNLAQGVDFGGTATISASFVPEGFELERLIDGRSVFNHYTRQAWTSTGSPNESDWIEVDLGGEHEVNRVLVSLWAWPGRGTNSPRSMTIAVWDAATESWVAVPEADRRPVQPLGMGVNDVGFAPMITSKIRVLLEHAAPDATGVSEIVVLGPDR